MSYFVMGPSKQSTEPEAEAVPDTDWDGLPEAVPEIEADSDVVPLMEPDSDVVPLIEAEVDSEAEADLVPLKEADWVPETDVEAEPEGDPSQSQLSFI